MINSLFFIALFLVSLRMFAFFLVVPTFFPSSTPNTLKVTLTLIIAYILMPTIDYASVSNINNLAPFFVTCVNEVISGLVLGFIVNLCFVAIRFGGNLIDMQMGLSMISMFDPSTSTNSTLIEKVLYWFSVMIFFIVDGHHMLIRALSDSFTTIKIGKFILNNDSISMIFKIFVEYFAIGLKIAIPIVLILFISDLTMGLVSRTVPQLNIMVLGLPIKILVGLGAFTFALPIFLNMVENSFHEVPSAIRGFYKTIPFIIIFASDDKTEEATPKRKSDSRKKGQVAKSKEVPLALTLLACTIVMLTIGPYVGNALKSTFSFFLNNYLTIDLSYSSIQKITIVTAMRVAVIFLPVVVPIMLVGVFANFIQTGVLLTGQPLKPDFTKLNPLNGLKRMFSMRTFMELIKDLALVFVVGYIGYKFVKNNFIAILNLWNLTPGAIVSSVGKLTLDIFFKITIFMIIIAVTDYIFQRYQYNKDLRMSKQEVKEEYKQDEGDPHIKGKRRQKQKEMAMRRMMSEVPKATVVVTNPTHLAIAIKYNEGENAPIVVAKGSDYLALKIKEIAKANGVPIMENKPLARLIYEEVEIDKEIPVNMYQAVAEILAFVYKLDKNKK